MFVNSQIIGQLVLGYFKLFKIRTYPFGEITSNLFPSNTNGLHRILNPFNSSTLNRSWPSRINYFGSNTSPVGDLICRTLTTIISLFLSRMSVFTLKKRWYFLSLSSRLFSWPLVRSSNFILSMTDFLGGSRSPLLVLFEDLDDLVFCVLVPFCDS